MIEEKLDIHDVESPTRKWWIKELPPAEIFNNDVKWLACDRDNFWCGYVSTPSIAGGSWFSPCYTEVGRAIKMPELSGDEWKHSLIMIDDLAEWQAQNDLSR